MPTATARGFRGAGSCGQVLEGAEIPRLDAAAQAAWAEVNFHWREGRLTSDLPGRVADLRQEFKPEVLNEIDGQNRRAKRAWYSTHPSHAERRKSLLPEPPEGVYTDERPARELFADFDRLCRTASVAEYKEGLGEKFDEAQLVERGEIGRSRAQAAAEGEAFVRMFGAVLSRSRELPLGIFEREVLDDEARAAAAHELPALAAAAEAERAAIEAANHRYADLEQAGDRLEALAALRDAGVPQKQWGPAEEIAKLFAEVAGAAGDAGGDLTAAITVASAEQLRLRGELRESDERAGRRLTLAIAARSLSSSTCRPRIDWILVPTSIATAVTSVMAFLALSFSSVLSGSPGALPGRTFSLGKTESSAWIWRWRYAGDTYPPWGDPASGQALAGGRLHVPSCGVRRRGALALHALWSRLEANRKNTRFGKELEARRRRWPRSTPLSPAASR